MPQNSFDGKSNIGSDNGLVLSGNKSLLGLMLTQLYFVIDLQWVNTPDI